MSTHARGGCVAAAVTAAVMGIAGAAAQAQGPAAAAQAEGGLEEIVVTAQKRSENLQTVPIAATALTAEALETRFIKSFTDISAALPNTSLEGEGLSNYASSFYIRGLGTQNRGPFVDPAVSVVVDGVSGGYIATALTDFMDIEAIEVLRGPQGTLQGRNSTGGAILVRHKRPDPGGFDAQVGLLIGNAGRQDISGMLNVPVSESAAFRIAVKRTETDGFFRNTLSGRDVGGQEHTTVLPSFAIDGESWNLTVRGLYNDYQDDSSTLVPRYACRADPRVVPNTAAVPTGPQNDTYVNTIALRNGGAAALQYCAREPDDSLFTVNQNRPIDEADLEQKSLTIEYNYEFQGAGTLTFVGNLQENEETSALDVDGTFLQLNANQENTQHEQQSAELRFASDFSDAFKFVAGVFWLDQEYDLRRSTTVDLGAGSVTPMLTGLFNGSSQTNTQQGVFAQGEWQFTDALTGVLGARYTKDEKEVGVCANIAVVCDSSRLLLNAAEWSDTTPRVGLNWQFDDDKYFYAYWAKGFRAGGFNGEAGSASAAGPFNPEEVKTIEIGAKLDLADNRLRLNLAIFDTSATDLQRQLARATAIGTAEIVTQNAAEASITGAEIEATWLPIDSFRLEATLGYLDAKYDRYCTDLNGAAANDPSLVNCADPVRNAAGAVIFQPADLTNLPLARTPDVTARLAGYYTFELGDSGSLELSAEFSHQGEQMTLDSGAPQGTTLGITNFDGSRLEPLRSSTDVVNASVTWKAADDRWRASIYGKNLTDEIYFRRLSFASPTLSFGTLADPREYGVSFQYNFGQ
jgi:iron complex outermembrane recepter protein